MVSRSRRVQIDKALKIENREQKNRGHEKKKGENKIETEIEKENRVNINYFLSSLKRDNKIHTYNIISPICSLMACKESITLRSLMQLKKFARNTF